MCGISGIASRSLEVGELERQIERMAQSLRHRGPDGLETRTFAPPRVSETVALAHNRLAIIDLSPAGREPMSNEDETLWLVFNGEIYNFTQLRSRLEIQGHRFRSRTDAEVILHLYEEVGPDSVKQLNGIFAFALLDLRQNRLLLARDPIGVKPLFYYSKPDQFIFGSEIKAVLAALPRTPHLNWGAVSDYFTYLYVPGPKTVFQDIVQLPPAHRLILNLSDNALCLERYWAVQRRKEIESASYEDLKGQVRESLAGSVKNQLISDVPLGIFLSGGVDSTIVAGLAKEHKAAVQTYTVIFEGEEYAFYNEAQKARAVSQHLHTDHRELSVPPTDPSEILNLVDHFDQPFGNPTAYLMHLLSKQARAHITVALCGAGGDELFAGYPRYRAIRFARKLRWIPRPCLRFGGAALSLFPDSYRSMYLRRGRKFFEGLDADFFTQYARWTYFLDEEKKSKLFRLNSSGYSPNSLEPSSRALQSAFDSSRLHEWDNRTLQMDVQTFLVDNILEYTDRMSMATALEVRVPLLDPGFVELSLNIPFAYKIRGGKTKALLKEAFDEFFPPIAKNAAKRGFNAPLAHWIRETFDEYFEASRISQGPFKDRLGEGIGSSWNDGILNWDFIQQLRGQHRRGVRDNSYELFGILAFDVWWRKYINKSLPILAS